MNKLLYTLSAVALVAACACSGGKPYGEIADAQYASLDSVPYRILVNTRADRSQTVQRTEYTNWTLSYPLYGATGTMCLVMPVDTSKLLPGFSRTVTMMELAGDTVGDVYSDTNTSGIYNWIFVTPRGKNAIQWLATDSATMMLAGSIHLDAGSDTTAALEYIRADLRTLLDSLRPL